MCRGVAGAAQCTSRCRDSICVAARSAPIPETKNVVFFFSNQRDGKNEPRWSAGKARHSVCGKCDVPSPTKSTIFERKHGATFETRPNAFRTKAPLSSRTTHVTFLSCVFFFFFLFRLTSCSKKEELFEKNVLELSKDVAYVRKVSWVFFFFSLFFYFTGRFRERYPHGHKRAVFTLALRCERTRITSPVHHNGLLTTITFLEHYFCLFQ